MYLQTRHIPTVGKLVQATAVVDGAGEHVLVLTRRDGPSPSLPNSGRVEHIELHAAYFGQISNGTWTQEWQINDGTDCPDLDTSGGFFLPYVSFTDLNHDGRAEVTVPYHLFCGGGIDSQTVKIIMRDGATKLAIRGESLVEYRGQKPFGGEHRSDPALNLPRNQVFRDHLEKIWGQVAIERR